MLNEIFEYLILAFLGFSGVLVVGEALGFLPDRVSRWLNRNRLSQTIETLRSFGIDVDQYRRTNHCSRIPSHYKQGQLGDVVKEALDKCTIPKKVGIGGTSKVTSKSFIDVMGATTSAGNAAIYARFLASHWRNIAIDRQIVTDERFDIIVSPKEGSPLLGYELARLLGKPFMMHCREKKFECEPDDFRAHFDCEKPPGEGIRALLVDDSTTGGGKALDVIKDLRKFNVSISEFLVIFEPELKGARDLLKNQHVNLHSIVKVQQ